MKHSTCILFHKILRVSKGRWQQYLSLLHTRILLNTENEQVRGNNWLWVFCSGYFNIHKSAITNLHYCDSLWILTTYIQLQGDNRGLQNKRNLNSFQYHLNSSNIINIYQIFSIENRMSILILSLDFIIIEFEGLTWQNLEY